MRDYETAVKVLDRVRVARGSELRAKVGYQKVLNYYLMSSYESSYNEILRLRLAGSNLSREAIHLEILNLVSLNRWYEAKEVMLTHKDQLGLTKTEIESIYRMKLKVKDPEKAYNMSFFLPGFGQMYSGYFFKGLMSAGVQTVLVGFSAFSIYNGYFFTGGMSGVALFYTFYFGGARHARDLAISKNKETSSQLSRRYNDLCD